MCSVIADEFEDSAAGLQSDLKEKLDIKDVIFCKKCGINKPSVVVRVKDAYCTPCLHASVTHKFRACLGKSKMMISGEKVIIAYSGGPASTALLQLTEQGLANTTHKRLRFVPILLYIDEGALLNASSSSRINTLKEIAAVAKACKFPAYVSAIEMVMESNKDAQFLEMPEYFDDFHLFDNQDNIKKLQELFSSTTSLSSKEDLLLKLRYQLYVQVATSLSCSKILLGDSETRIAVRVLADIALGKGRHLAQNCGFADDRHEDVVLIRPLREILAKEISFLVNASKLPVVFQPKLTTKKNSVNSIQQRTEAFVFGLQEDFPGTVSTIFRTGDKMGCALPKSMTNKNLSGNPKVERSCILCSGIMEKPDFNLTQCCSRDDIQKSEKTIESCSNCSCSSKQSHITISDVMRLSCYSCRIIFKEMGSVKNIPPHVLEKAMQSLRREQMRSEIANFLLDS